MRIKPISTGSKGNAYLVETGAHIVLLDAGVPIKKIQEATGFKLSSISAAFISHRHLDHAKAVRDLLTRGIKVYANYDTHMACGTLNDRRAAVIENLERVEPKKDIIITAFEVKHDVPCMGFYIQNLSEDESLVYITDAHYCRYKFEKVTHWLLEANFSEEQTRENVEQGIINHQYKHRVWETHMSIEELKRFIEANDFSQTKQIYLIHMSDNNAREQEFVETIAKMTGVEVYAVK